MADEQQRSNTTNAAHLHKASKHFDETVMNCLKRGFYGEVVFTVKIENGVIQKTVGTVSETRRIT